MTLDEMLAREAIRALMAKCTQAGDSLRAEEYASCFAEDGTLITEMDGGGLGLDLRSRAEILAWQTDKRKPGQGMGQGGPVPLKFARHNLTTSKIEVSGPDSARARTYWHVMTNIGPDHAGIYRDTFRRVDGEWLIAERRVKTEWAADNSLMVPAGSRPGGR
ncbi:MAG: nuclear transport factor 2 family protein [Novosphingobium sp.]